MFGLTDRWKKRPEKEPQGGEGPVHGHGGAVIPLRARASGGRVTAHAYEAEHESYPPGGLRTFRRMLRDAQVRACLKTKTLAVVSETCEVRAAGKDGVSERVAETVHAQMHALPGGMGGLMESALDALAMGYSVGEYVWGADGRLARIAWHDPARFRFVADRWGQVTHLEPIEGVGDPLPRERFVVWSYQGRYGCPYGESDLLAAYRPWASKDQLLRAWWVALDRMGAPTPLGKLPQHASEAERETLINALQRIRTEAALVVPDTYDVSLLESGRFEPGACFALAVEYHDKQIAKAILGQTLTTDEGARSGSLALGRVHQDVMGLWFSALRREIAETVLTAQIAATITRFWFGPEVAPPRLVLGDLTNEELQARRELILGLVGGHVVAPDEGWIRGYLALPSPPPPDAEGGHA